MVNPNRYLTITCTDIYWLNIGLYSLAIISNYWLRLSKSCLMSYRLNTWLDTNRNSMLSWFLHTEFHFINTTNSYIQTLQTKTSDLKKCKQLFNKQDKILICWWQVTFIGNWISLTLSKSTLVSEFKNYVEFALTKRCLWYFQDKSSCFQVVTHCRCSNRKQMVQTVNGWERMRMGENASKLNTKKTSCYKILPRKYVKIQTVNVLKKSENNNK